MTSKRIWSFPISLIRLTDFSQFNDKMIFQHLLLWGFQGKDRICRLFHCFPCFGCKLPTPLSRNKTCPDVNPIVHLTFPPHQEHHWIFITGCQAQKRVSLNRLGPGSLGFQNCHPNTGFYHKTYLIVDLAYLLHICSNLTTRELILNHSVHLGSFGTRLRRCAATDSTNLSKRSEPLCQSSATSNQSINQSINGLINK